MSEMDVEFLIIIKSFDELVSNILYSRTSYTTNELVSDARFNLAYDLDEDGNALFHIDKLDDYTSV